MTSNLPENTNTTDETENDILHVLIPYPIRFVLLLIFEIPSTICYIFVFGYILSKKTLRSAPNNYVMLIMLFVAFAIVILDIPWQIDYYRRHTMLSESPTFCLVWWFIDISLFFTCQMLAAWASFERHILIFHDRLFNQKWKKICFHYMPPFIVIVYMTIFYIYVLFVIPCENSVSFENDICTIPCYLDNPVLGLWELIFHSIIPTLCIIVFSGTLLIRVYRSKTRLQQSVNWRKYRKMIFQLISISSLYLLFNLPYFIIYIFYMTGFFEWALPALECLRFFSYCIPLFFPFICLTSLPKVWMNIKSIVRRQTNQQIQPMPLHGLVRKDSPRIAQV